jgi:hypothetical protein
MLKQTVAACALLSFASPGFAQSSDPRATAPSNATAPVASVQPHARPIGYLTEVPPGLFSPERLKGVEVIGLDIKRIGEIEDVLVDRTGRVAAVVIEVGGFLGIGEKHVAVPFEALLLNFEASPTQGPSASTTGVGLQTQAARDNDTASPGVNTTGAVASAGGTAGGSAPTRGAGGPAVAGGPGPLTPMAQGSGDGGQNRSGMEVAMGGAPTVGAATIPIVAGELKRAMLRATRADLEKAPEFRRAR